MHKSKALLAVMTAIDELRSDAAPEIIRDLEELSEFLKASMAMPLQGTLYNNPKNPLIKKPAEERPVEAVLSVMKLLCDAGIVPPHCRRVVIDMQAGDAVRVYYEIFGDARIIDVVAGMVENNTIPKLRKEPSDL